MAFQSSEKMGKNRQEKINEKTEARKLLLEIRKKDGNVWSVIQTLEEQFCNSLDEIEWHKTSRILINGKMVCMNGKYLQVVDFGFTQAGRVEIRAYPTNRVIKSFILEEIEEMYVNPETPFGKMLKKVIYSA